MSPVRCPYCHEGLGAAPTLRCRECATAVHVACWVEHGGCPILGCAARPAPVAGPGAPLGWEEFVREATPWLELGASLVWDPSPAAEPPPAPEVERRRRGSGSGSRAA